MREISLEEQTVNAGNPLARFAHRSRLSMSVGLVDKLCAQHGTVVNYGEGPDILLRALGEARPDVTPVGYDMIVQPGFPEIRFTDSLEQVTTRSVDVLTAFEVCEHLHDHELDALLANASRILKPRGAFVISVPIMYGAAIVPKVTNWMIRSRTLKSEYRVGELLKAMFGIRVDRPENFRFTHKGFDFRELRDVVSKRFVIDATHLSPMPNAPWWLSSQFFMICRPKAGI